MILILKLFIKEEKLLFFITNLRAFCIHFLQILPSESAGNTLRFRGKKQYIFQTKFFPSVCPRYALGMPSFNNSVRLIQLEYELTLSLVPLHLQLNQCGGLAESKKDYDHDILVCTKPRS